MMHFSAVSAMFIFGILQPLSTASQSPPVAKWVQGNLVPPRETINPGETINILTSYGYLREGLHVIPTNSSEPWTIRLPTKSPLRDEPTFGDPANHRSDIEFEFCPGPKDLMRAYFRHFSIEGIPRVWYSFLIGWDRDTFARWMGIKKHFMSYAYSYVLVRVVRRQRVGSLLTGEGGPSLTRSAEEDEAGISVGDEGSVLRFFEKHGTHYVANYTTGGLVYQVYAYSRKKYSKIMDELRKKTVKKWSKNFFDFVFSPWFSDHSGDIIVSRGNATIQRWIERNLNASFFIYSHHSLLNVYRNESLMQELATLLGDDMILEMTLKTLVSAIGDEQKRSWTEEILMNRLTLWDVGI